jgi:hypothetical protein
VDRVVSKRRNYSSIQFTALFGRDNKARVAKVAERGIPGMQQGDPSTCIRLLPAARSRSSSISSISISLQYAVRSSRLAVGSWQLAVGSWQFHSQPLHDPSLSNPAH